MKKYFFFILSAPVIMGFFCGVRDKLPEISLYPEPFVRELSGAGVVLSAQLVAADTLLEREDALMPGTGRWELAEDAGFRNARRSEWALAEPGNNFYLTARFSGLKAGTAYWCRLVYGPTRKLVKVSTAQSFTK